jgi:2,4-dichlorophenol 6-monooxygenase
VLDPAAVRRRIDAVIGDPTVDVELLDVTTWQVNQAWAPVYGRGRVFCGGDAVHRHPPSSGLGSNTSIQDAHNLAWKLAYVLRGWADPSLLASYTAERAPVGRAVVERANRSRADYRALNELLPRIGAADGRLELDRLRAPTPEGVQLREALVAAVDVKNEEFNAQGTELNQRYRSDAVVVDATVPPEDLEDDGGLQLRATTRPGAKLPHAWLVDDRGRLRSTLDLVGKGRFTVVTGLAGRAWCEAVERLDLPYLAVATVDGDDARDAYHDWFRLREVDEAGALLVRPDGYVAWRQRTATWDPDEATDRLSRAVGTVLGTRVGHLRKEQR